MFDWIVTDGTGTTTFFSLVPEGPTTAGWLLVAAISTVMFLATIRVIPKAINWLGEVYRRTNFGRIFRGAIRWGQKYYLFFLLSLGFGVFVWVFVTFIGTVVPIVGALLVEIRVVDNTSDKVQTRNLALAIAAFAGMLAVFSTVPFRLVRAWINERTAKTQEATHITGLINTAVEGLGAEKTVSRIGRVLRYRDEPDGKVHTKIEWEGDKNASTIPDELVENFGDWKSFSVTEPNLEVRIGAILTLERIARDNPDDHIRVMDILCAYIRENSKAEDEENHTFPEWPKYPAIATTRQFTKRRQGLAERKTKLKEWVQELPTARTDIQGALEVIGKRSQEMIETVEARPVPGQKNGYRLDLRKTNLQKVDMSGLNFSRADLRSARMEGANLREVNMVRANLKGSSMVGADLWQANMSAAVLQYAQMEGTNLWGAVIERADLWRAQMQSSNLQRVRMREANLRGVHLEGADLSGARCQNANFRRAWMEGAILLRSRLDGVDLRGARLEGAQLKQVRLTGADLSSACMKFANWTGAHLGSPAHSADFRGAINLKQSQLDQIIGDNWTLLPQGNAPDTDEAYTVGSCWESKPHFFDAMAERIAKRKHKPVSEEKTRSNFLCGDSQSSNFQCTLADDAPYPKGHSLERFNPD